MLAASTHSDTRLPLLVNGRDMVVGGALSNYDIFAFALNNVEA